LKRAKAAGLTYIDQGTGQYADTIKPLLTERPILLPQYRGLTDQQQIGRDDLIRQGQATLASSGLRGAGRAGIGVVLDQVRRYDAAARDGNDTANRQAQVAARGSADSARQGLAGVQANAGSAKANTEIGVGTQSAGIIGQSGQTQANLASSTGQTAANLAASTGQSQGNLAVSTGQLLGNTLQSATGYEIGNSPNTPTLYPQYAGGQQNPTKPDQQKV